MRDRGGAAREQRALVRRLPGIDLVCAQDVHLGAIPDAALLAWAAEERRIVLTHDFATRIGFAYFYCGISAAFSRDRGAREAAA